MYEAIIIWVTGEKETHKYATEKEAYKACDNYVKAFVMKMTGRRKKMKNKKRKYTCCICGHVSSGFGNNAEPVCTGECCNRCNNTIVIPERIKMMRRFDKNVGEE